MNYEIEWTAPALRELRKLDKALARRLLTSVTKLGVDPRPPDPRPPDPRQPGARTLIGQPAGTMRLRVGDYRVVYVVHDDLVLVTVVRLAHRRDVYRGL